MIDALRRLANLGTDGLPEKEARHVRIVNAAALIGTVLASVWVAAQLAAVPSAATINGCFLFGYVATLVLNARRRHALAQILILLVANTHILMLGIFAFSVETAAHRWYLLFALAPFLVLPHRYRVLRYLFATTSLTLSFLFEFGFMPMLCEITWTAQQLRIARMVNFTTIALSLILLTTRFVQDVSRAEAENERLLRNILPPAIAARLRADERTIADGYEDVSILFADIVGFTLLASRLPAGELVRLLNEIFSAFDEEADRLGLEKIKTIGDAYMVAAGVPDPRPDHALALAEMARRMREVVAAVSARSGHPLEIRIGIHTGSLVAGVIGTRKFAYDLWGDAVNVAARMESHGAPGEIQVSHDTWLQLKEHFAFEPRGRIPIKGKGELEAYFLRGPLRLKKSA